ncbi:MAG: hypothetical protein A2252_07455 [Elusimicrobia bacterium RIFOXYA2_FULL_39_19]|nr:MAG: hypothetical protein A2252_07455 [Elusimicrobia bacterium RIFOXYA2_FULL_39_19]
MKNISIVLSTCVMVVFVSNAYAYIDPGSTSVILQVIFAFVIGGLLAFKNYIKNIFGQIFKRKQK